MGSTQQANQYMQANDHSQPEPDYVESILPWLLGAVGLVIYLITLNHWVTVASLPAVAQVTGWDWWSLNLQAPLFYLLTWPIRLFPPGWHPLLLNLFSAICAAGALGLLARSVSMLPHDRTRDQRLRERSEFSLLSIPAAWLPPVLAVLALGLQLTFWEHATAATGEALNVLMFAYLIRCLLEFRLDQREAWLNKMALVFGLAVTNNFVMIAYFPAFVAALIWIKGLSFFNGRFLLRLTGWGALGLALYLLLPLLESTSGKASTSFLDLLRMELSWQKGILMGFPRFVVLLCGFTSLLPVMVMGIRWKGSFGETSILGNLLTNLMFRVVHIIFLAVCLWVVFDPPFSPRMRGLGYPFITFYYLTALAIGYYSGYFLLVFGTDPEKRRHHVSEAARLFNRALAGLVWVALAGIPAGLIYQNWPKIQANNSPCLRDLATTLASGLPEKNALVLSDEPIPLLLVEAVLSEGNQKARYPLVDTRYIAYPFYHRLLARKFPGQWPKVFGEITSLDRIESIRNLQMLAAMSRTNELYYLHPSFDYVTEGLYGVPHGLVYRLQAYPDWVVALPALNEADITNNLAFWNQCKSNLAGLPRLGKHAERGNNLSDAEFVARFYARAANYFGVRLQRNHRLSEAGQCFELALAFNPDNDVAFVNRAFNRILVSDKVKPVEVAPAMEDRLKSRRWEERLRDNGPFDEIRYCSEMGQNFALSSMNLIRQAAQEFLRVQELEPGNFEARAWLANLFLKGHWPDKTLEVVTAMKALPEAQSLPNQIELVRLEAWAYAFKTNVAKAEQILLDAQKTHPGVESLPETLGQIYLQCGQFTNALLALEQQLKIAPNNVKALLNKGALCIRAKQYQDAIPALNQVIEAEPKNDAARMNRAIALLQSRKLDEAQRDYEALLDMMPHFHKAYFGLGEIAYARKDSRAAIANYELYLKYVPRDYKNAPRDPGEAEYVANRLKELRSGSANR